MELKDIIYKLEILQDSVDTGIENEGDIQECINYLKETQKETVERFKNDCISILKLKYDLRDEDAKAEVNALDYIDYIQGEDSTEDYIDELVSCWFD